MKKRFEHALRVRFVFPALIAIVLALAVASEWAYQRSVQTLGWSIELADARIESARILRLLTEAQAAHTAYLLTQHPASLEPMYRAEQELKGNTRIFSFISKIGPTGPDDAKRIESLVLQKFEAFSQSALLSEIGKQTEAMAKIESGEDQKHLETLRALFESKFSEARGLQDSARTSIYDTLLFNRVAALLLTLMLAIGLYWYWLKLKQIDEDTVARQKELEVVVKGKTKELRTLAGYFQTVREDERAHLARELHDELGGLLTAAKLTLARMRTKLAENPEMLERIEQINGHLNNGIALKRRIVEDLSPSTLKALGLKPALDILCQEVSAQLGFAVDTNIAEMQLSPNAELGIFRTVQESLTNIGKYAKATRVAVTLLAGEGQVLLDIQDNGKGFDVTTLQPGRHGLAGMRFRVESLSGVMTLRSAPGEGVHISVRIPHAAP